MSKGVRHYTENHKIHKKYQLSSMEMKQKGLQNHGLHNLYK